MSRYSPTVLPQPRTPVTSYLADAIQGYTQARQFRDERDQTRLAREVGNYQAGIRSGTAPAPETMTTEELDPQDLSRAFTPDTSRFSPQAPAAPAEPFTPNTTSFQPIGGAAHPGGFDPQTHTFGGTPQRHAAVQAMTPATPRRVTTTVDDGRYVQLDPGHYIDTYDTAEARGARTKMAEFEMEKTLEAQLQRTDPKYQAELVKYLNDARRTTSQINADEARARYYDARGRAAGQPRQPTPDKPGEAEHRQAETASARATTARNEAEVTDIQQRARQRVADQLIQSLAAQNPGRTITAEAAAQYLGGLQRNGKAPKNLTPEDIYGALDRYHNPPNRADTPQTVMARQMSSELQGQRAGTGGAAGGRPAASAKTVPPLKKGTAAKDRYNQLATAGMSQGDILAQMQREGYPPPPKK